MIYNEDKTEQIENPDLSLGYLKEDILEIKHEAVEGCEEEGHYNVIAEYPDLNGCDVEWVVDKPGIEAQEEYIEQVHIQVYIPYTEKELFIKSAKYKLETYKQLLNESDYKAIKFAEGWYSKEEYEPIKAEREALRVEVRKLLEEIEKISQD